MIAARWLLFAWGWFVACVMGYFLFLWITDPDSPLRGEAVIGFGMALIYGMPSWLGLPLLVGLQRSGLTRKQSAFFLAPVAVSVTLFALIAFTGGV
jgi:hypothetical protein